MKIRFIRNHTQNLRRLSATNNMHSAVAEPQLVQVRLIPAQRAEQRGHVISGKVVIDDPSLLSYIDDASSAIISTERKKLAEWPRYYAVGPGTYQIKCPLCNQRGEAAVMRKSMGNLQCCFSRFCCLKICPEKSVYCNKCGGKLGASNNI